MEVAAENIQGLVLAVAGADHSPVPAAGTAEAVVDTRDQARMEAVEVRAAVAEPKELAAMLATVVVVEPVAAGQAILHTRGYLSGKDSLGCMVVAVVAADPA